MQYATQATALQPPPAGVFISTKSAQRWSFLFGVCHATGGGLACGRIVCFGAWPSNDRYPPASRTISMGALTVLNAAASGTPPPTVQWQTAGTGPAGLISRAPPAVRMSWRRRAATGRYLRIPKGRRLRTWVRWLYSRHVEGCVIETHEPHVDSTRRRISVALLFLNAGG